MSITIPGTDLLPEPVGGSGGGVLDDGCTAGSWQTSAPVSPFALTATTAPNGYLDLATNYPDDPDAMLQAIFGDAVVTDNRDHVAFVEFTNQRNGERYRVMVWHNSCY